MSLTLSLKPRFARLALALVAVMVTGLAASAAAQAIGWGSPTSIDHPFPARSVSCPTTSFCMAAGRRTAPELYSGGTWTVGPENNTAELVSCTSATFCVGVGSSYASVFNGSSWTSPTQVTATTGLPLLEAVSCTSEAFCVAVDENGTAYKFNGTSWTSAGSTNVFGEKISISCVSTTFCVTVAGQEASTFNGTSWSSTKVLTTGALAAVSCLSESFCVAAGSREVRYNGISWSTPVEINGEEEIKGIACESSSVCVAVGAAGRAMISSGASWGAPATIDSFPSGVGLSGYMDPSLTSVSCTSSTCHAVDSQGRTFTLSGSTWSGPVEIGGEALSVSCPSGSFCAATDTTGRVMMFNGTTWSEPTQIDGGAQLTDITCTSASFCVALDGFGNYTVYNGSSWSVPAVSGLGGGGRSASCLSRTFCMGVGAAGVGEYNGSSWSAPTNMPALSVSCTSETFCVALGYNEASSFNGTSWGSPTQLVKNPSGAVEFESVSCVNTQFCLAVDYAGRTMTFNGSSWNEPVPPFSPYPGMESVSCTSTSFCAAAAENDSVFTYNGSAWGAPVTGLLGDTAHVSCGDPEFCIAVSGGSALTYGTPGTPPTPESSSGGGSSSNGTNSGTSTTATATTTPAPPPTSPPVEVGKPSVSTSSGQITLAFNFPEPGSVSATAVVEQGATVARVSRHAKHAGCRRGFLKHGKKCVDNRPVPYGSAQLTITAAGAYKLMIKPSGRALAALLKGKTLSVTTTIVFTPAGTTDHIRSVVTTRVHLKRSSKSRKRGSRR